MKIYKYTPHVNLFLESSSLKLTPVFQLNDPFEAKVSDSFINNFEVEFQKQLKGISKDTVASVIDDIRNNSVYKGVISLSKKKLDIIMLSHYASDHKGGILEFELNSMLDGYDNETQLFQCGYERKYNFGRVKYDEVRRSDLNNDFNDYLSSGVYFEKYSGWSREEEVRYVSDFRYADYIIIPKKSLVKSHFQNFKINSSIDMVSCQVEGDSFYYIYKSFDGNTCKECLRRSENKKIRSIVDTIFGNNILNYEEKNENILLTLKCRHNSHFEIVQALSWRRFLRYSSEFHPMLKVNCSALTGIYLGCRFNTSELKKKSLDKFPNLSENIMQTKPCGNDFKLNPVNVLQACN